jgi:hypothetical protein
MGKGSMRVLALVAALTAVVVLPASAGAARKVPVGISDQNVSTLSDPLFTALDMKYVRYVTPWDVALNPQGLPALALDAWLAEAAAAGLTPMVAFEHRAGDNCPHEPCTLPTEPQFTAAFTAFRAKYPQVRTITVWNEANHSTQPTFRDSVMAAVFYKIVAANCAGCTIVAADVLDSARADHWLSTFSSVAPEARLWGLHNWGDVNRFKTNGVKGVLRTVKGNVWLTETGGIVAFTTVEGHPSFHPSEARAAKAMNYLFQKIVPISSRIKRVYVYNWISQPTNRWDSGLIDHSGDPRPIYDVVKAYTAR